MTTLIRSAFTVARARRTARHLADVSFCDSCAQVCDSSCRTTAHQRRTQYALSFTR
ncbi:hypothetical protein G5C60_12655 [Streptomyces sp. HC44]|uniref:Uncharacterized protein n=1 Tax=Streptomyces scabichelini TaxID=2711217 RepID=A0A6G4V365_9ACTN|nr:hypothetical protein [Streptomyces scabichelini]NGO08446.1 hypothetical protein [Streptomyces scabichelini]